MKDLLIIIPAYNEEENLPNVLNSIAKAGISDYADILVMNDASSDATNWVAKQHHVTVVSHVFNLGYGSAIQLGYKYAVRRNYQYVIQMDADGQHDICNIPKLYEELKSPHAPDIVIGSRFLPESTPFKVGALKEFAIHHFSYFIYLFTRTRISDPTSGLQGLSFPAFLYYSIFEHFDDRYPDANMILQMLLLGFSVKEIPAVMHQRVSGTSMHSGLKPVLYMARVTLSLLAVLFRHYVLGLDNGVRIHDQFSKKEVETEKEQTS